MAKSPPFWELIKEKAINNIAAAIITGALLLLSTGAAATWALLKHWVVIEMDPGAVVAFDLPDGCPDGWLPFEPGVSRVIVGASGGQVTEGPTTKDGVRLHARHYRDDGGEEAHFLTLAEIPPHKHGITFRDAQYLMGQSSETTNTLGGAGIPVGIRRIPMPQATEDAGGNNSKTPAALMLTM